MKNTFRVRWLAVWGLGLGLSLVLASTASAADLNFTADTTVPLDSPAITLTVLSGSAATSMTVNTGTVVVEVPVGSSFSITSASRDLAGSGAVSGGSVAKACNSSSVATLIVTPGSVAETITITPASSQCASTAGGGGGGGGGGTTTTTTPTTTTPTTTPTTETPAAAPTTTTETPAAAPTTTEEARAAQVVTITQEAATVTTAAPEAMAAEVGKTRDTGLEQRYESTIVARVVVSGTPAAAKAAVVNFVTYGTPTTTVLGAGERAGVVNSFRSAFGKVPQTEADWSDVIKIANGRFPSVTNATREKSVETAFRRIYLRAPVRTQANDNAAITVMAYGLRTATRNLNSEKAAINSFKAIYGKSPATATDWDAVRAVAYSGAKR